MGFLKRLVAGHQDSVPEAEAAFLEAGQEVFEAMTGQPSRLRINAAHLAREQTAVRLAQVLVRSGDVPGVRVYEQLQALRSPIDSREFSHAVQVIAQRLAGAGCLEAMLNVLRDRTPETEDAVVAQAVEFWREHGNAEFLAGADDTDWHRLVSFIGRYYRVRDLDLARQYFALMPDDSDYALCFSAGEPEFEAFIERVPDAYISFLTRAARTFRPSAPGTNDALWQKLQESCADSRSTSAAGFFLACAYWHARHELTREKQVEAYRAFLLSQADGEHLHVARARADLLNGVPVLQDEFLTPESGLEEQVFVLYRRFYSDEDYALVAAWAQTLPEDVKAEAQARLDQAREEYEEFVWSR